MERDEIYINTIVLQIFVYVLLLNFREITIFRYFEIGFTRIQKIGDF